MTNLCEQYGYSVTHSEAVQIIGVSRSTIYRMVDDGRLTEGCGGRRVLTESIEQYLHAPRMIDFVVRMKKKYPNCKRFAV